MVLQGNPREREEVFEFMQRNQLAVLSTLTEGSTPYGSAVLIIPKPDLTAIFASRSETHKIRDILANPMVSLTIYDADTLEILQMRGIAEVIMDAHAIRDTMESLRKTVEKEKKHWMSHEDKVTGGLHHVDVSRWSAPIAQMQEEGQSVYVRITPAWARFRRYDADWQTGQKFTEYIFSAAGH